MKTSHRWEVVVVRDKLVADCDGATGDACRASCGTTIEVPGTEGAVRYHDKCEDIELLGSLSPTAEPIDADARAHTLYLSDKSDDAQSFTEFGVRSLLMKEPCSVERSCRVHWYESTRGPPRARRRSRPRR